MEVIYNVPKLDFNQSPMKHNSLGKDESTDDLTIVELQRRRLQGYDISPSAFSHKSSLLSIALKSPNTLLNRTLSNPFSNSWEHNNIDASSLIESPKFEYLKDSLNLKWKKELMNILFEKQKYDQDPLFKRLDELCFITEEEKQLFNRIMNQDYILDGLVLEQSEGTKYEVQCGSVKAIIRSLIFFDAFSEEHIKSVLMTHEYWMTSKNLFNELVSVFWFQSGNVLSTIPIHENYVEVWRNYIRKRILRILFIWINTQPYNFKDVIIQNNLIDLILSLKQTKTVNKSIINVFIKSIRKHIKKKETIQEPIECNNSNTRINNISIFDMNPKRFSIQISHFESNEMKKIQLNNFKDWKSDLKSKLNHVYNRSKLFQRWIMTEILSAINLNQSVIILGKFISLMRYCLDLQNFHTTYEIFHALQHERIKNLYSLWKKLSDDILDTWRNISRKLKSDSDYFDSSLEASHPKILPISLCLKFISSIEKEPTLINESQFVNFSKLRSIYQILKEFSDSQNISYEFEPIPEIQNYLEHSITGFDEYRLDYLSKEIEIAQSERLNFYLLSPKRNIKNLKERESSPIPQSLSARERRISRISVPRKTTSAQTVNTITPTKRSSTDLNSQLFEEAEEKWNKSLDKCSVGQDLPRFANKMVLMHGKNVLIKPQDNDENLIKRIHDILFTFSELLNANEEKKAMEEKFHRYYDKEKGDVIKETDRLIRDIFGEKSVVTKLLKATCSQGIVSPAWIKLKLDILNAFHFKDLKKSWYIAVIFGSKDIMVVHRKQEISINENGESFFQFTWEMTMTFDSNMNKMLSTQLNIVNLDIMNLDDKKASELKAAIKPWYTKHSKYPNYMKKKSKRFSGGDLKKKVKFSLSPQRKLNETL